MAHREDLIGYGKSCLIPPRPYGEKRTSRNTDQREKANEGNKRNEGNERNKGNERHKSNERNKGYERNKANERNKGHKSSKTVSARGKKHVSNR